MTFSKKQNIFIDYLLNRIGFKKKELIDDYKIKLESIYGKYNKDRRAAETYPSIYTKNYYVYKYSNSECVEELLKEIDVKKNLELIVLKEIKDSSKISATDLSSFDFCPASYAISKSFEIEYPTNEDKRNIGINLHETLRLVNKKIPKDFEQSDFIQNDVSENITIKKIKNCELILSGHAKENVFFENQEMNFIGQPDYIFKDPNGNHFVVEEKFKYLNSYTNTEDYNAKEINESKNRIKKTFFSNHLVQLSSYLNYINDYDLQYGVLIYWFYDFNQNQPFVHSVSTKVVKKGEYSDLLKKTNSSICDFNESKIFEFENKVNPKKCCACVVNKYCGHKTDEKNKLSLPYNKYDLKLKSIIFPTELKKNTPNIDNLN